MTKQNTRRNSHQQPPAMIASSTRLNALIRILADQPAIAVDTESNSLYAYQERVCLIQFSTPTEDYLVDPLANLDLSPLGEIFAHPDIQKVFHAAEYDVMCLKRDYGFQFHNLFDTMWAARILGWPRVGLGDILTKIFNVKTQKRYQRYNWGRRPLEKKALQYATIDTHYLLPLRALQLETLERGNHLEEAREVFEQIAATEPRTHHFDPDDFWRIKGAYDLTPRQQAILRELYIWRDQAAQRQDRPPFKIVGDTVLLDLARLAPHTERELANVQRMKEYHVRRYGADILRAIVHGESAPPPPFPPRPPRRSNGEIARYHTLRAWRKAIAARRGVESDVILSNNTLWEIAKRNPQNMEDLQQIASLGPWKRDTYGRAILRALAKPLE